MNPIDNQEWFFQQPPQLAQPRGVFGGLQGLAAQLVSLGGAYPPARFRVNVKLDLSKWAPYLVSNLRKHITQYSA